MRNVTAGGSALGGAAPFAATRFVVAALSLGLPRGLDAATDRMDRCDENLRRAVGAIEAGHACTVAVGGYRHQRESSPRIAGFWLELAVVREPDEGLESHDLDVFGVNQMLRQGP